LRAGEETGLVRLDNPSVVVQVHDGKIHVTREDGLVEEMNALGNWVWRDSSSPFVIRNLDDDAVEVVVNEARR